MYVHTNAKKNVSTCLYKQRKKSGKLYIKLIML